MFLSHATLKRKMARVLFTTFGSYGDLHPYLAIGVQLQRMGHSVTIATSASYCQKVTDEGLGFLSVRPEMTLADGELMRQFFDRYRGTERVIRVMVSVVRESYQDTLAIAPGFDLIVTHPMAIGAVLVAQKLNMPWISSVLAPASFLSAWDPPVPAPFPWLVGIRKLGPGAMRAVWKSMAGILNRWMQPVHDLRREIGLPPGGNPLLEGSHSPHLMLALFSRVFAEPQPDWPASTAVTGFPFHDEGGKILAPELEEFLQEGPPPIVFTLGSSAVMAAGEFYSISLKAVKLLGQRALFLTGPERHGLPQHLPEGVMAWPYAPHEPVFFRASAIVHQGGVGTTAQALRSGRPMLVMPFAHDQYDNAARVQRLGAGLTVTRNSYRESVVADALRRMASFRQSAEQLGNAIRAESGAQRAAQEISKFCGAGCQPTADC
jgi:UDP:flavonoid glycosyltransferase YjiC (YdhE family)